MTFGRTVVLGMFGIVLLGGAWSSARAQVSVYGEFSASDLHNLTSTDYLYGGTAGLLYDGPTLFKHLLVSADIQGRFVRKSQVAPLHAELYNGITVGPRFSVPLKHGISPYGEFLLGFARYDNGAPQGSTTDSTLQINAGAAKRLTPRLDLVADYSYSQYYGLGGQYNPKTYSLGGIFHFTRR